jgi:hypothetical protein
MDMTKVWSELNWLAVMTAAFSTFLVGGVWYTALDKVWSKASGLTPELLKSRNMLLVFGLSLLLSLIMALNLALFIGKNGLEFGLIAGSLTGLGWVLPAFGIVALFEKKPLAYVLVNGLYMVVAFTLMGSILGVWK